ncbi:MAG: hypothetical protein ACI86H_000904 [bacterium]|jgi:hypothetical protein
MSGIAVRLFFYWIFISLIFGVTSVYAGTLVEVATGDQTSASSKFIQDFSDHWNSRFANQYRVFQPFNGGSFKNRKLLLEQQRVQYAIFPAKMLKKERLAKEKVRLISLLWKVYLVPVKVGLPDVKKLTFAGDHKWYIPKGSVIFPQYLQWKGGIKKENILFLDFDEWLKKLEAKESGFYLYEMTGAFYKIVRFFKDKGQIMNLPVNISEDIKHILPFTENIKESTIRKTVKLKTVGYQFGFFGLPNKAVEDERKLLLRAFQLQPRRMVRYPYLFSYIKATDTKKVNRSLLDISTQKYFKLLSEEELKALEEKDKLEEKKKQDALKKVTTKIP